ncbi:MAG: septum site-determining protein MinD [Ruminococcaceae bacterium]|nr:septum site-determining protein MinD [Oscillospiraceae bacterium]
MCEKNFKIGVSFLGRAVMVTSFKGGVGKTTVSANLSMALAQMGFKVIAIDCDLESRCLDIALGLENATLYNICEVITGKCTIEEAAVTDPRCRNLSFIAAPAYYSLVNDEFEFTDDKVKDLVFRLKLNYDFVIFDLPARPDKLYKSLVKFSNYALVVSLHTAASIRAAEKTAMALEELGCGEGDDEYLTKNLKTRLVINSFMARDAVDGVRPSIYEVINKTSVRLIGVLPYDADMARGQENGLLAYQVNKGKNNFNRAICNVAKRFTENQVPLLSGLKLDVSKTRLT